MKANRLYGLKQGGLLEVRDRTSQTPCISSRLSPRQHTYRNQKRSRPLTNKSISLWEKTSTEIAIRLGLPQVVEVNSGLVNRFGIWVGIWDLDARIYSIVKTVVALHVQIIQNRQSKIQALGGQTCREIWLILGQTAKAPYRLVTIKPS